MIILFLAYCCDRYTNFQMLKQPWISGVWPQPLQKQCRVVMLWATRGVHCAFIKTKKWRGLSVKSLSSVLHPTCLLASLAGFPALTKGSLWHPSSTFPYPQPANVSVLPFLTVVLLPLCLINSTHQLKTSSSLHLIYRWMLALIPVSSQTSTRLWEDEGFLQRSH